jgi:hypothetical protein
MFSQCKYVIINDKSTCKSGVYKIFPDNTSFEVYCEMEKYGGGWTVSGVIGMG